MSKESERAELHRTIWKIANDLRGSVDGWDFKQYILGFLFYRFISENLTQYLNDRVHKSGDTEFDYTTISDEDAEAARKETIQTKGFYILPSQLFQNIAKNPEADPNLNANLKNIFASIEESAIGTDAEEDFKGLFDDIDLNSAKLGNSVPNKNARISKIINAVGDLKLGNFHDNTIDAFGDAYEYLLTMYAANAGKSGGEFFTPQEVSELLARITLLNKKPTDINRVYDPACGSGSLLLKYKKIIGDENDNLSYYGQEINLTTYNLARMNMFLHNVNFHHFDIALGDTLTDPKHWDDQPFDAIVSNPPYSIKWEGDANPLLINDSRFAPAGVLAPKSKADLAFTMHMLAWLSNSGTAAIVEFPGVLYRSGAEQKIRKYLVDGNFIDAVIQLPSDLFFGTSIATCIVVLKKSKSDSNITFIDASTEFTRGSAKNKLTEANVDKILGALTTKKDSEHFAKVVTAEEVKENDYNLSVSSYVEAEDTREVIDIKELNKQIAEIVKRENELRASIDEIIKEIE